MAQNLNINSVIIIADTIIINCPNLNANYNAQLAEFIGNESEPVVNNDDTELEVVAYGDYDVENETFTVYWNTTVPEGTFDILISDDKENYTLLGTVNDDDSYEYIFTESFDKKYIKVVETTKSGKVCESIPFIVISTEEGVDTEVLDSDDDGLPDIYELKIGTDLNKVDTDEDGLTDYQEYVYTNTDPLVYDSVAEGTSDADIDTDEDGLSNIDELTRGTYPWTSDTDNDGLSDYDEIFVYNTDPLVPDSDEDGIDDGSEIKLSLDPNAPATNGVPDGEYVIPQSIKADNIILSSVNTAESPYELSIDIKTNGDAEKELTVDESGYSAAIENDAMIGASIDVELSDTCNPEEIVLKYNIKESYTENTLNKFSSFDEFIGIKRLNIFTFDEEQGMLLPIDTEFDVENNQLYAEVNETGTYCLMDMEIWLDNLGVEMPDNSSAANVPTRKAAPKALPYNTSKWEPTYVNAPIDIVFFIETEGRTGYETAGTKTDVECFEENKTLIKQISSYMFSKYDNVNVHIISYDYDNATIVKSIYGTNYHTNYMSVQNALSFVNYKHYKGSDRDWIYTYLNYYLNCRNDSDKFIFNLINGTTVGIRYMQTIRYAVQKGFIFSQIAICSPYFGEIGETTDSKVKSLIASANGIDIVMSEESFSETTQNIENNLSAPRPVYDIIVPTKWKKISLKGDLTPNGTTNSDADSLTDWEEVDTSKIKVNSDNSIELPVFCMANIVGYLTRFNQNGEYNFLVNDFSPRYYLPIISDPTMKNSDGDAFDDSLDPEPLYHDPDPFNYSNILSMEIKYIPLQKVKSLTGKIGRQLAKKWDCDVYISILKSCDCDDDIFILTNKSQSLREVFVVSDELKKKLNNGEKEYSNSYNHVLNEEAAHVGKLETDQLVPEFFDKDSSYYYGNWYHNYCQALEMYKYYSNEIDKNVKRTMNALVVYNIATCAYQNYLLSSTNTSYEVLPEEYIEEYYDSMAYARNTGKNGELASGITKNTRHIESITKTAKYRIPDGLDDVNMVLSEVKNVEYLPLSIKN